MKKNDVELQRDFHGISVNYDHDTYLQLNAESMKANSEYWKAHAEMD